MRKITRDDLITAVHEAVDGVTKARVKEICGLFLSELTAALEQDGETAVELRGFGVFKKVKRGRSKFVNPRTGETVVKEPGYSVVFKKSKSSPKM